MSLTVAFEQLATEMLEARLKIPDEPDFANVERHRQTFFVGEYINACIVDRIPSPEVMEAISAEVGGDIRKNILRQYSYFMSLSYHDLFEIHSDLEEYIGEKSEKQSDFELELSIVRIAMIEQKDDFQYNHDLGFIDIEAA